MDNPKISLDVQVWSSSASVDSEYQKFKVLAHLILALGSFRQARILNLRHPEAILGLSMTSQDVQWGVYHTAIPGHAMGCCPYLPSDMQWGIDHTSHHRSCNGVSIISAITEHAMGCQPYLPSPDMQWGVDHTCHHTCNGVWTIPAIR